MSAPLTVAGQAFAIVRDGDGVEHVTLVSLCEPFGLKPDGQRARLQETAWATLQKIWGVRSSGKRAAFVSLPLDQVPMYFATLSPGHVNEAFRPALIAMQKEVAKAIGDYYLRGGAVRADALPKQLLDLRDRIDEILRPVPTDDYIWPARFVKRYAAWHNRVWKSGERHPFSMQSANDFFYLMIFPRPVYDIIKAKGLKEGVRYHQVIADVPRDYLQRQLDIASVLADECGSETEWRARMRRAYGKTRAQLQGQVVLPL